MAAVQPASHIQAVNSPADSFRRAIQDSFRGGSGIVTYPGDMQVTQTGTPSMAVAVAAGRCIIPGSQNLTYQGHYDAMNDASVQLTISAADPTNPRIDLICASVQDAAYSGAANQWLLQVVQGTPAASPSPPTTPANTVVLAQVRVNAAASSILNSNITDVRTALANTSQLSGQFVAAGGNGGGVGAFTVNARFLGMLASSGAPATGTYLTGDWGFDSNGIMWTCTAGGTPGTWRSPGGKFDERVGGAIETLSTVSFTLPSGYRHAEFRGQIRSTFSSTADSMYLLFNSDTAADYVGQWVAGNNNTASATQGISASGQPTIALCAAASSTAGLSGEFRIEVRNYSGTTFIKTAIGYDQAWESAAAAGEWVITYGLRWNSTAAVTTVTLTLASGTFATGSYIGAFVAA